jgi:glycerol uptake facilitator protein
VWAIGSGLGGTTGFAINPARDLGPRIAHAILPIPGKGSSDFAYGLAVPVAGGLVGGALAGLFLKLMGL